MYVFFFFVGDTSADLPDIPQNHKRSLCDLTVADRLAVYDHVMYEASQQSTKGESNNEDLYVDLVAKLKKGTRIRLLNIPDLSFILCDLFL